MKNQKLKMSGIRAIIVASSFVATLGQLPAQADEPARGKATERPVSPISTEANLREVVARLDAPATRLDAVSQLADFSSSKLYQVGSVFDMDVNPLADKLQNEAVKALRPYTDIDTVGQALESKDRTLQFFGIWFWGRGGFKTRSESSSLWRTLMPRIERLAIEGDELIRGRALEELQNYSGEKPFLMERLKVETSPGIVMRLCVIDSSIAGSNLSAHFNPYLLRFLAKPEVAVRLESLIFIGGNKTIAPMWQIEFDPAVKERVTELTASKIPEERKAALYALAALNAKT